VLLPLLSSNDRHFSPLSQYLAGSTFGEGDPASAQGFSPSTSGAGAKSSATSNSNILSVLTGLHTVMAHVCDVKNSLGAEESNTFYRLNRQKALEHLSGRVRNLASTLHAKASAARTAIKAQFGSFVTTSTSLSSTTGLPLGVAATFAEADLETALGILSEYLDDTWVHDLASTLGYVAIFP
jgi:hypothetical protein